MTDAVAGVPLPPKRPTIIRPSVTSSTDEGDGGRPVPPRPAPARPAPPPPGGGGGARPPVIPNRPPHKGTKDGEPRRSVNLPPSASTIPPRPHTENNAHQSKGSVKKRPEITILSAKPMSEVGFRGDNGSKQDSIEKPARPTRPVPPHPTEHHNDAPSRPQPPPGHPRPPPPNRSSTSGQPPSLLDDDFGQSSLPPPMPLSQPPPLPGNLLDLEPDDPPVRSPPPTSRPPPPPPRPEPSGGSHPVPLRPPPLPSRPRVSGAVDDNDQPPTPPVRGTSIQGSTEDASPPAVAPRGVPPVPAVRPEPNQFVNAEDESNKVLPTKPLRPTIIRPAKPLSSPQELDPSSASKISDDNKVKAQHKDLGKDDTSAEPEYAKVNKPKLKPNIIGKFNSSSDQSESTGHGLPFRVKLRSTVTSPDEGQEEEDSPPALPPKNYDEADSPPLPKPKPSVLPKPKPSPDHENVNVSDSNKEKDDSLNVQPPVTKPVGKRPTIIRPPPKPKRLHEADDETESSETVKAVSETEPDISVRKMPPVPAKRPNSIAPSVGPSEKNSSENGSISPRPVPARRPVSVAARFEQQIEKQNQADAPLRRPPPPSKSPVTGKHPESSLKTNKNETEDSSTQKQITPPKPKARRTTPVSSSPDSPSLLKDDVSKTDESHDEGAVVTRPPPPRPSGRPRSMIIPKTPDSEGDGEESPSPKALPPPRPAGRPLSMVLPKETHSDSAKNIPTRPGGPPQRKTSEDVSGEEGESPKGGPPRPAGRPVSVVAPRRTSIEEEDDVNSKDKPPRPSGPPPPKLSPLQKDDDEVQKRPPRPTAGPPRPMSMPVRPPQPSGSRSKPSPKSTRGKTPDLPPRPGPDHLLYNYILTVPHAIAKHDYDASQEDELSFKTEETVLLVRRIDSDWLVGRVGDKEGMFPAGFVDIIHPLHDEILDFGMKQPPMPSWDDPEPVKKSPPTVTTGPRCVARFDFDGEGKDDLTFEEDDVIKLICRVGTDWLRGELNGKTGIFPLAFVEIVEDLPLETVEKSSDGLVTAMFDFDGRDDELSFQAGQKLKILSQINTEWLYGEIDGRKGKFPSAFIDYIPPDLPQHESDSQSTEMSAEHQLSANHKTEDVDSHQPVTEPDSAPADKQQPYCVATYDYEGQHEEDLSFKTGEVILLLEKIGTDWLRGSCQGKQGMFPVGFVTIEKDLPESSDFQPHGTSSSSSAVQARALFDFDGESDKELTFKTGEIIHLGDVVEGSPDWQYGSIDSRWGMFPTAFVEVIS